MSDERIDKFLLAEYSALREEVKWLITQIETLEYTALIFSGAIWAWGGQQQGPIKMVVIFLPLILSVLLFIKRESLRRSLREAAEYLMKLESHFNLPDGMGWDHHLRAKGVRHFRTWKKIFWS